jgi:hypothetical protein
MHDQIQCKSSRGPSQTIQIGMFAGRKGHDSNCPGMHSKVCGASREETGQEITRKERDRKRLQPQPDPNLHSCKEESMAKKQSITKTAVQETPKSLNLEASKIVSEVHEALGRFVRAADGLRSFCYNTDEGNEVLHDFSFAVGTIAEMIQEDAKNIRAKLGKIEIGGER